MTGYHERDNIKVEEVLVNFASKTWLSQPLQFHASNIGWTGTNYQSYDEGKVIDTKYVLITVSVNSSTRNEALLQHINGPT